MKNIIFAIFVVCFSLNIAFAQDTEPKLTAAEIREAQQLAAKFYNRLVQTQNVEPLIKEFFIQDFALRYKKALEHDGDFTDLNKFKQKDIILYYKTVTNYFNLYFSSVYYLQIVNSQLSEDEAEKIVDKKIEIRLKNNQDLKLFLSKIPDIPINYSDYDPRRIISENWKSLANFRQSFNKINNLIAVLQKVEIEFRNQAKKILPKQKFYFSSKDFEVSEFYENIDELNFPKKTKILDVGIKNLYSTFIPCTMILVKVNKNLKVFIITTPPQ